LFTRARGTVLAYALSDVVLRTRAGSASLRLERQPELDWLRGLMLVLMTVTHLPTWFGPHAGQPFGYVSAAEGFVFLSGLLVGRVYSRKARAQGMSAMRRALAGRALKVYGAHVALLLSLLLVFVPIAVSRDAHAITDLASYYLQRPHLALASGLVLAYNPPLLDILPMYVVFLVASPAILAFGLRRGWGVLLTVSAVVWLAAQYDGGRHVYRAVAAFTGWPVPYGATGAFSFAAWQFLWLIGMRVGANGVAQAAEVRSRARGFGLAAAVAVAVAFLVARHVFGQVPFPHDPALAALFDKWRLGPLRLLNFAVLAVIVAHLRPALVAWAARSSIATLGRASLIVFSTHVLICLALLTFVGAASGPDLRVGDVALLLGTLALLYATARASLGGGRIVRARYRTLAARLSARAAR
jgi:hypothetical protein